MIPTEKADLGSRLPHLQIPAVPRGPLMPLSPFSPSRPGLPDGPMSPFSPIGPGFPAGPRSPRSPILPVGPTLPFNPVTEKSCKGHNFCIIVDAFAFLKLLFMSILYYMRSGSAPVVPAYERNSQWKYNSPPFVTY